jgi:hypothetical protein
MKPWTTWLARLGIAGACFLVTGCGGSDVPDASDDGQAAAGGAPDAAVAGGGVPAPAAPVEEPKVAQEETAAGTDAVAATRPAPAPEAETPVASEGQAKSSTAEMLALATAPPAGSNASAGDSATPSPNAATPGTPGAMAPPGGPGGMMAGRMGGPGMGPMGPMGPPGAGRGGPNPADMEKMRMAMMNRGSPGPGGPGSPGGPGGYGGPGGAGMAGADNKPADFRSPEGAVTAFLAALKAKNLDRLNESTALRASQEAASSKNKELFKKIFDLSLSESELDDLASKLDGYRMSNENPPKSTARVEVVLVKAGKNGAYTKRTITTRHEKKGWGVLDVSGPTEFKAMAMPRRPGMGGGRR